ncbi:MAG: DUF378 domain-containing protein [Candidatus Caccovivens sp.]
MITFIAFVLTILGSINWLLIGLLQYDFIAGLFGFQASIFSRMVYIIFGIGAIYLSIRVIVNKGSFKVFERKKKKQNEISSKEETNTQIPVNANVEASREQVAENYKQKTARYDDFDAEINDQQFRENEEGLFDEHFKNR